VCAPWCSVTYRFHSGALVPLEGLKVKPRRVERLGVPRLDLRRKTKRYLMRDVLQWLERRRVEDDAVAQSRAVALSDASDGASGRRKCWRSSRGRGT
jgi:hypothetical protein